MNRNFLVVFGKAVLLLCLLCVFAFVSKGQSFINLSTDNCTVTEDEIQMDILVTNTGKNDLRWNGCVIRMNVPASLLPAGNQTYTLHYLGGTDFPLSFPAAGKNAGGAVFNAALRILSWASTPNLVYNNTSCNAPLIAAGQTKKIGRFSFKISSGKFLSTKDKFTWHPTSSCILYTKCDTKPVAFGTAGNRSFTAPCSRSDN